MAKSRIDINPANSGKGVKEALSKIAELKSTTVSGLVRSIISYSIENKNEFTSKLKNPRPKSGLNIVSHIESDVLDNLSKWQKERNVSRVKLVSYIIEKVLEDDLVDKIIPSKGDTTAKTFKILIQANAIDKEDIIEILTEINELYKSVGGDELVINQSGTKKLNISKNPVYA